MIEEIRKQAIVLLKELRIEDISDIQIGTFDTNGNEHTSIDIVIDKKSRDDK